MKPAVPVVVFGEIDQTFLAGETQPCAGAGDVLAGEAVTLILCSSMTRAELEICQHQLGLVQPFICESGAAVLLPDGCFPFHVPRDRDVAGYHVIEFGRPYTDVVAVLHRTAARLGIGVLGFSDMSVEEVAGACGLSLSHARLAKLRDYDEPFRVLDRAPDARERLWKALRAGRLECACRGRFDHVGAAVDTSTAVGVLKNLYRRSLGTFATVEVGSAPCKSDQARNRAKEPLSPPVPSIDYGTWIETILEAARDRRDGRRHPGVLRSCQ